MMFCKPSYFGESSSGALTDSAVSSFLGPNKNLKFIIDDGQSHLVSCALPMFQLVSSTCLFDNVIVETLYAQHEQFGYGATSLLAMFYFWNKQFELLVEKGLQVNDIIDISKQAINHVISMLPCIEISTEKLLSSTKRDLNATCVGIDQQKYLFTGFQKSKDNSDDGIAYGIKLKSRHFAMSLVSEEQEKEVSRNRKAAKICLSEKSVNELLSFAQKVCHNTLEVTTILTEIWKQQIMAKGNLGFQTEFLSVVSCIGPKSVMLVDGLLLEIGCADCRFLKSKNQHRLLLVSGDITMNYMHLGFSPTTVIEMTKTLEQLGKSDYCDWIRDCSSHLLKLQISILLVFGVVDTAIEDFCRSQSILLISNIPWKILNKLSKVLNVAPVSYLLDSDKKNVSFDVSIETWAAKPENDPMRICLRSSLQCKDILQTVVLSHPCQSLAKLLEHQFWHLALRLNHATNTKSVLPGGGYTEKWCCEKLTDWSKTLNQDYEREIALHIGDGYLNYQVAILKNKITANNEENVFDNVQSKCEMWNSALTLCFCHLNTDLQLINGCDDITSQNFSQSSLHIGNL